MSSTVKHHNLWDEYRQSREAEGLQTVPLLMLSLQWRDGRRYVLSYAYLMGIAYDPLGKLQLDFTAYRVVLSGIGLERLLMPLSLQQTDCLAESEIPSEQMADRTYVLSIDLEER